MHRILSTLATFAALCLCMSASVIADEDDSAAANKEFEQHRAAIADELKTGSLADWAGEYGYGDGLGVNVRLSLAPNRGFAYRWTGCLGIYGQNYGTVVHREGRLALDFVQPNKPRSFGDFSRVLVPVPWGNRLYLIGEEQLAEFVNAVNSGLEPCAEMCGSFLLRDGDQKVKATGMPTLPADYSSRLLDKPLYAHVTKIIERDLTAVDDEYHDRKATVELDAGSNAGIWEGMEFHATTGDFMTDTFTVVRVGESSSVASIRSYNDRPLAPESGLCVSTRFIDDAAKGCKSVPVVRR